MQIKPQYSRLKSDVSPEYLAQNREIFTDIEYLPKVYYKNTSRYKNLRTIQDNESGKLHHESWFQKFVDYSDEDEYYTVTMETENRLDIIAEYYYNSARYWWIIACANYIFDPFDIPKGTKLRIPPLVSLYNEGGILSGK